MKALIFTTSSLLSALLLFVLVACTGHDVADRVLDTADSLSNVQPDSALHLLDSLSDSKTLTTNHRPQTIDSCQQPTANSQRPTASLNRSQRMRLELLRARCMNKAYIPVGVDGQTPSDSMLLDVVKYYDRHGTPNEQTEAHYLLGCAYRDMGEAPHAVDCYLDAIAKADTTAEDCDYRALGSIYAQMAFLYHQQLLLSYEIEAHRKASHFNYLAKDTLYAIYEQKMIACAYILQNKKDSAAIIVDKAMHSYHEHGYLHEELQTSLLLMHLYVDTPEKLGEVKLLMDRYEALSEAFSEKQGLQSSMRKYYYYKGRYYEGINMPDTAEVYYRKLYRPGMSFVEYDPMYSGLLSVFKKKHAPDSIAKYAQLYCAVNDSSIAIKDRETTAQMMASYNYNSYQKQALHSERKANRTSLILVVVIFLIFFVFSILYLFWKRYRTRQRLEQAKQITLQRKKQQEMEKLKTEFIDVTDRYNKNRQALQLLKESHQTAIKTVQEKLVGAQTIINELNRKYENNISLFKEENESLKMRIEELSRQQTISTLMEKSMRFGEELIVKRIIELSDNPKLHIRKREWEEFVFTVGHYYPELLKDLKEIPDVTIQEIHTALLVLLNIRTDDIARLLGVSGQRATNIKSNLNLTLFGIKSARSFYNNMKNHYSIYLLGK